MESQARIIYLSFDGILEPLGHGQVARVLMGLAEKGWRYELISLEKKKNLADQSRVQALKAQLQQQGVRWHPLCYQEGGSPRNASTNVLGPLLLIKRLVLEARLTPHKTPKVQLLHARSYLGAWVCQMVYKLLGVPYLFDTRGYWIDERKDQGRWFSNAVVYRLAKQAERSLYNDAAAAVSLTQLGADDIQQGRFGPWGQKPVAAIPTCVDQDAFTFTHRDKRLPQLKHKLVISWVGSINNWYYIQEGVELFTYVLQHRPDAHLLWLTGQVEDASKYLKQANIPKTHFTVMSAKHEQMPELLGSIDWGLLLLKTTDTKRASMPTKLAEFFASGVRPIHYGCNSEVYDWVAKTGSGFSLDCLSSRSLQQAAQRIAEHSDDGRELGFARFVSGQHFSLEYGIERYDQILNSLLQPSR